VAAFSADAPTEAGPSAPITYPDVIPSIEAMSDLDCGRIARVHTDLPRYTNVAKLVGMDAEFAGITTVDMVEDCPDSGSTDSWSISFALSDIDRQAISSEELERELTLMQACWAFSTMCVCTCRPRCRRGRAGAGVMK
jgi:hypothetical protein